MLRFFSIPFMFRVKKIYKYYIHCDNIVIIFCLYNIDLQIYYVLYTKKHKIYKVRISLFKFYIFNLPKFYFL